jgi:hypothetical protein
VLVIVELDEGARMPTNLVGVEPDPEPIRVGMRVNVVFRKLSEHITLPLFDTGRQRHFGLVSPLFRRQLVSPQTNFANRHAHARERSCLRNSARSRLRRRNSTIGP